MGGSSRSSNSTTNKTNNYNLQGVNAQAVVAGNGNTVTSTDYGAISGALQLADNSGNRLLSLADSSGERLATTANNSIEVIRSSLVSAMQQQAESGRSSQKQIAELAKLAATGNEVDKNLIAKYVVGGLLTVTAIGLVMRGVK